MPKDDKINEDLSREQILDLADAAGRKLGTLLAMSPFSTEQKEAFLNIIQDATPEQIGKLTEMLEDSFLMSHVRNLQIQFEQVLQEIKKADDQAQNNLAEETAKKLEAIKQKIV